MKNNYAPQAAKTRSNEELAAVVNQMLSQLQSSHTYFYTQAEPAYYQLLGIFERFPDFKKELQQFFPDGDISYSGIGAFIQTIDDKLFVRAILDGSPAEQAGLMVEIGYCKQMVSPTSPFSLLPVLMAKRLSC